MRVWPTIRKPAGKVPRRTGQAVAAAVCFALASCSSAVEPRAGQVTGTPDAAITIAVNQSRTNYGTRTIDLLVTNNGPAPKTVTTVILDSGLFVGQVMWTSDGDGTVLPPGQPKSLATELPEPECGNAESGSPAPGLVARLQLSGSEQVQEAGVSDAFGVLERNRAERCLALAVQEIAAVELLPGLQLDDPQVGTLRLAITPRPRQPGPAAGSGLTIEHILETTLLAAAGPAPWPEGIHIRPGDAQQTFLLPVRPARCDPHAVAEDKVGTLLPLQVSVNGGHGTIKVAAGAELKGAIHDFVSAACASG